VADKKSARPPLTEPLETSIHVDRHRVGRGRDRYMLSISTERVLLGIWSTRLPDSSIGIFGETKIVTGRLWRI